MSVGKQDWASMAHGLAPDDSSADSGRAPFEGWSLLQTDFAAMPTFSPAATFPAASFAVPAPIIPDVFDAFNGGAPWSVAFDDTPGTYAAYYAEIVQALQAAADAWSSYLGGSGSIQIQVKFQDDPSLTFHARTDVTDTTISGSLLQSGVAAEIETGTDPNGSAADMILTINPRYLAGATAQDAPTSLFWFDPNAPVPAGMHDAFSTFEHEIGHALGIVGPEAGSPGGSVTPFDQLVTMIDGAPYFIGANAEAVYGGPVPLDPSSTYHVAVGSDLMTFTQPDGEAGRAGISPLDLAMLNDTGLPIANGTDGDDVLSTVAGQNAINGGAGDDTLTGGAAADTLTGGSGNDTLTGGAANDTLIGGDDIDTAVYGGNHTDYTLTYNSGTQTYTVVDQRSGSPDGTDTVSQVEQFQFADGLFTYDTSGQPLTQTLVDVAGTAPWLTQTFTFDAQASISSQTIDEDNGTFWINTFDTTNDLSMLWSTQNYDAAGNLLSQVVTNDDGTHVLTIFDIANAYRWTNATITFDANWNETSVTGTNDDNSHTVTQTDIAAAFDTLSWFATPYDANLNAPPRDEVLTGGANPDTLYSFAGNDTLSGGGGNDLLVGGRGNDTLTGGLGDDRFVFTNGDGRDTITDFTPGNGSGDVVELHAYGISSFAALQPFMAQVGSDTVIVFDPDNQITLHNVTLTQLNAGDFAFL